MATKRYRIRGGSGSATVFSIPLKKRLTDEEVAQAVTKATGLGYNLAMFPRNGKGKRNGMFCRFAGFCGTVMLLYDQVYVELLGGPQGDLGSIDHAAGAFINVFSL